MKMRPVSLAALCVALFAIVAVLPARGDSFSQNFDSWPRTTPNTLTNNGWSIGSTNAIIPIVTNISYSSPNSLRFPSLPSAMKDGFLQLPYVTNGAGTLSFYFRSAPATNILIQSSPNGTNWTTFANVMRTGQLTATFYPFSVTINQYGSNYYRFLLTNSTGISSLFIDNVVLSEPQAQLQINSATAQTTVGSPDIFTADPVNIVASYTPVGLVSNVQMTLTYKFEWGGASNNISMVSNGPNSFITSLPVPGQSTGKVYYYVRAAFSGPAPNGAASPTNYPVNGFTNTFYYTVAQRSYNIQNGSMITTGALASAMNIVDNYAWESFVGYTGSTFSFQFQGVSNVTTRNWGDANPARTTPPFDQAAEVGAASIQVTPSTNQGQLVIRFKEQGSLYTVKEVAAETFDVWSAPAIGSHTNSAGWVLRNGLIDNHPEIKLRNGYAVLESNTTAWLRSPYLPGGVGEVSLWCRNFISNGSPAAGAYIEKSTTGADSDSAWTAIGSTNGLVLQPFQRLTLILSDRDAHYIRIRNTTNIPNARLCLDEVMVGQPGAGVQFANTSNSPAIPAATNPVAILSTITPLGGGTNLSAKIWYRSGTTGTWASITMTNAGSLFTTLSPIPAGKGDKQGGAGTVQYYVECAFTGYDSGSVSPFFYPAAGSQGPASFEVSPATVQMSNPLTDPATPVVGSTTKLLVDVSALNAASNLTLTAYYRVNGTGGYSPLVMAPLAGSTYRTSGAIPAQATAGTLLEYYFTAAFQGPSAQTPTNYPIAAPASVFVTTFRHFMQNTSMTVTNGLVGPMFSVGASLWETFIPYTGTTFGVQFKGNSNGTLRAWGDSNQTTTAPPFSLTAELAATNIAILPTTNTGVLLFRFSETNRAYTIKQTVVQKFDAWDAPAVGNGTNGGWVVAQGLTGSNALLQLRGRYLMLDSNSHSWIASPAIPGGIGEISFWHRNFNASDTPAAGLIVEKSSTGGTNSSEWVFLANVTNIAYSEYRRFTLVHPDRNYYYVRVRTSTNRPNARICLDELMVAQPGAGVAFTAVTNSPGSPLASDGVSVTATIAPVGGSSALSAKVWYRSGTTGAWASVAMANTGYSFYTTSLIPAGIGDKVGGAGLVQYYIECAFQGYERALSSPLLYPASGAYAPLSYTIQSSWLLATNPATAPAVLRVNSATRLRVDLLPQAGANAIAATAWYRFGGAGAFTSMPMSLLSTNTYQTTGDLPVQSLIGQPLEYYFTMTFGGPNPASPTNLPVSAPASYYRTVYHAQVWTSVYSSVTVTGDVIRPMIRSGDKDWRAILTVTNKTHPRFRFAATGSGSPLWGDLNPPVTALPVYGTAENGAGSMVMTGAVSGTLLFQFNDTNLQYSAQRASYADLTAWPTSNIWSTNGAGWLLGGRSGRTNDPDDSLRIFDGPFLVLQGGSSTNNFLRSPAMTNGIGEVSFFYRNWDMTASNPVSFVVEVSPTNNTTTNGWTVLQQVPNLLSADYLYFRTVLPDPWTNRYVRIRNTSSAINTRLCLDETVVSDSGSYLAFSNLTHSPADPTIMDLVNVSVYIYGRAGATNFTPILWYKATTNSGAYYEPAVMTNVSGALYRGTIPQGPIGPMFYYVQSGYSGFLSDSTSPQNFPVAGSTAPNSYTNTDTGVFNGFETWPRFAETTYGINYTNDGWIIYRSQVRGDLSYVAAPGSTNKAVWFDNDNYDTYPPSSLLTPFITNLYGTVYLTFMMTAINSFELPHTVKIYTTYDADPIMDLGDTNIWTYKASIQCISPSTIWLYKGPIEFTNNNFRILIAKESGEKFVGIDQVEIAQRSSMITFSNLFLTPGYPGTNEPVVVSIDVDTLHPGMPAFNFKPSLYYRSASASSFQGPFLMGRVGSTRRFTNSIPGSLAVWDTNTSYYISCAFDGYAHTPSLSQSPMYHPTDFPTSTNTYMPRLKPSDYGRMYGSGNRGLANMDLLEDYVWQGVLNLTTPYSGMSFSFNGYDNFTGSGFSAYTTNWGRPNDQWKTNLPLADTAIPTNYTSIIAAGQLLGQYVMRLNERTGEFTLQSCLAQYFETWPTTTDYMLSGNSESDNFTCNFNDWPTNLVRTQFDNFDVTTTWSNTSGGARGIYYYTNKWYGGTASWGIYDAMVTNKIGEGVAPNQFGVMLTSNINLGRIMNSQAGLSPLEGVGTISFWYKPVDTNIPTTLKVNLAPIGSHENPTTWETIAIVSNILLGQSNVFSMAVNTSAYKAIIIEHTDGQARIGVDNVRFTDFAATYYATNGWKASEIWIEAQSGHTGNTATNGFVSGLEFDGRRANTNAYLESPLMTNGVGFFDFWYKSANARQASFDIYFYRGTAEPFTEEKLATVTNIISGIYQSYSQTIMTNSAGYIRLVPTSTNRLVIDDVRITGIPPANSWEANNVRIASESGRKFRGTVAYLNNGSNNIVANMINLQEWPYIKSPIFSLGVGEISFWYRNYENVSPQPGTLRVQTSVNGLTGNANWTDVAAISNIVNTRDFQYFRTNLYDSSVRYVRIINDTNKVQKARIIVDEMLVTQPMAADIRLTNLRVTPEVPVATNDVHVYVDVKDFFLYPSNIVLQAEYSVGTSYGDWSMTNVLAMDLFTSNTQTRTWTYKTIDAIPHQPAERFIQYQARASFDGMNAAGHTSPKLGRQFTTPAYYYPLDYGTNIPYYIVYSSDTNAVWINEIDPGNAVNFSTPHYFDFVELAGRQGIDISNWKILFFSSANPTQVLASYTINPGTSFANMTNGLGFYLLGKDTLPVTPNKTLTNDIFYPGGVAIQRPAGMYSIKLAFGDFASDVTLLTQKGFTYIGGDEDGFMDFDGPRSIYMTGSGSVSTSFIWQTAGWLDNEATPLMANYLQEITGSSTPVNNPPAEVQIVDFWFSNQKIWITVTGTNGWLPSPWFTTNLMVPGSWTNLSAYDRYGLNTTNWTYTLRWPIPSNAPAYFYKVVTTNASN
jgi:hypothetical protein